MRHVIKTALGVLAGIAMFAAGLVVYAQSTTGTIYGTVEDPSGAAIVGCTVTARDTATGVAQTAITNQSGAYTFQTVDPGDYSVSTTTTGFKTQTQTGVRVAANDNVHVAFQLATGSATENVSVAAGVTMVDTREAQIATTIGQQELQQLPSENRDVYSLVATVPGVTNYSAASLTGDLDGTTFSVNGLPANMVSFYLDGSYNDVYKDQSGGNAVPNPDALEELHLITSNFDAEFGRTPAAVVNAITRSGTQQFHGEAYDYIRNDMFEAKPYFQTSVPALKQNQFGGNLGGPLLKNGNAFFFVDYQGTILHTPAVVNSTSIVTATALERAGDFRQSTIVPKVSCNGVAGVICPSAFDPVAVNLLKFVPIENPDGKSTVQQSSNGDNTVNQGTARVDYHGFQNHSIELLFFTQRGTQNVPGAGGNAIYSYAGLVDSENQDNIVAGDTWILSPSTVNSFRAFYVQNRYLQANTVGNNFLADLGSQAAEGGPIFSPPVFVINGYWQMGPANAGPNDNDQQAFGAIDTISLTRGQHAIKFGGSYVWDKYSANGNKNAGANFTFTGSATGNALADFLEGKANSLLQSSSSIQRQYSYDPSLYIQDDWQIRPRLNVNLGLRWEVFPPFPGEGVFGTFAANVQSQAVPGAPLGLLYQGDPGIPAGVYATSWTRFAPRIGFAADLFGNGRTSLRGGYGIFYFDQAEIQTGQQLQQPFVASITINKTPNLVTPYAPNPDPFPYVYNSASPRFVSGTTIFAVPTSGGSVPYVEEYNLNIEQQLTSNFAIHIGYVGNATRKNYLQHDINAPIYAPGAATTTAGLNARRPYQPTPKSYTFGAIELNDNVDNETYNSLQASLQGRIGRKFTTRMSYVWGKSLGYAGPNVDNSDIARNFGPAAIDLRQRFVASYTYLLPEVQRFGALGREAIDGWHLSGITSFSSGVPFAVTSGVDTNLDGTDNDRANVVGSPYFHGSGSRAQKIQEFIDPAAFAVPTGPYGNEQQRGLVGPGDINTDLALFKDFAIEKNASLRFRAEAFNAFGNVNLSTPRTNLTTLNTGVSQITSAAAPRIWQFAAKLRF